MSDRSAIEWTGATWNPVTGCDRVSPGCDHCYAMTLAKRLKAMGSDKYQTDGDPRTSGPGFGVTIHPRSLDEPFRWRSPRTVFVNSMADLFHARVALWFIREVFEVMRATPQHTYQILTKRSLRLRRLAHKLEWPSNVWMGVSVENVDAFRRIEDLRQVPAAVRFLSCEPLLGPLDGINLGSIDWVIAGGESGPNFRPIDPQWVRHIRDTCTAADVPFFFKQWGGRTPKAFGRAPRAIMVGDINIHSSVLRLRGFWRKAATLLIVSQWTSAACWSMKAKVGAHRQGPSSASVSSIVTLESPATTRYLPSPGKRVRRATSNSEASGLSSQNRSRVKGGSAFIAIREEPSNFSPMSRSMFSGWPAIKSR